MTDLTLVAGVAAAVILALLAGVLIGRRLTRDRLPPEVADALGIILEHRGGALGITPSQREGIRARAGGGPSFTIREDDDLGLVIALDQTTWTSWTAQ